MKRKRPNPAAELHALAVKIHSLIYKVGDCLVWRGPTRRGQPFVKLRHERVDPRRVIRELALGPLKRGARLRVTCNEAMCCSPVHVTETMRSASMRLLRLVDFSGPHWLWRGARFPSGHGRAFYTRHAERAARALYRCFVGAVPEGCYIKVKCGVDSCVNPLHVRAAPAIGPLGLKRKIPTRDEVEKIRRAWKDGEKTNAQLAEEFNLSPSVVTRIARGTYRVGRKSKDAR